MDTEPSSDDLLAALDLGSNSFHMIVARMEDGRLHVVDKMRERVRLAAGLDASGNIDAEAQGRALACLERFGQRLAEMSTDRVRVVGTNTLRKAKNGPQFIELAKAALRGHQIEIVAGREEARLIYLGVAQTAADEGGKRLCVDIGGGSTECIIGEGFEPVDADSLFMGCVSYSKRFFPDGALTAEAFEDAEIAAQLELQPIAVRYRRIGWANALGCSGTIHAINGILEANSWSEEGITRKGLKKLKKALVTAGTIDALRLDGLESDRRPVISGGVAILTAVFDALKVKAMVPSPGAMREGLLYDLAGRIRHEDVRDRTIRGFLDRYSVDREQATRVANTALGLLGNVTEAWRMDEHRAQQLLEWAALLHEIGMTIAHTGYHRHGAYIVANADMAGFSRDDQQMLAALIAGHRRKIKPTLFTEIPESRVDMLQRLLVILRLAVGLNRSRAADAAPQCVLRAKKERLTLAFPDGWLEAHPLSETDLLNEANHAGSLGFELVLKTSR